MKIFLTLLFLATPVAAQQQAEDTPTKDQTAPAAASEKTRYLSFQFGADAFGGPTMAGQNFIAGVNAGLYLPVLDWLRLGPRPALHYGYDKNSPYENTWLHADLAVQMDLLRKPLELYALLAGGYLGATDGDTHGGLADGWSALGAVGLILRVDGPLGVFLELGFRGGRAGVKETELERDASGNPICADQECLTYRTRQVTRHFDLAVFSINLGLAYSP
jgi:hypothetical protein